jgi:acyl dehydratase
MRSRNRTLRVPDSLGHTLRAMTKNTVFERRGLWFEEFHAGLRIESPGRTITEADIVNFAGLSGDFIPLHTDEVFARRTPYRGRIAHGMLVQAVATGLGTRSGVFEGTIGALASMTIRWTAPVFPGDTIRLVLECTEIDPEPTRRSGRVTFAAQVLNQKDTVVVEGEWETLMLREGPARARAERNKTAGNKTPGSGDKT